MRRLPDLLKELPGAEVQGTTDLNISGVFYDSREVKPGGIFVCITGFQTDGHKYIDNALANGAVVLVVEKDIKPRRDVTQITVQDSRLALAALACAFYNFPSGKLNLIGVTGTNGKTSLTYLIRAILQKNDYKVGLLGTIANLIEEQVLESQHTTPESSDLQQLFSRMVEAGIDYTVMEVSSHALELERVAGSEFNVAVFTNLTQDHLDFHPDLQAYFKAKAKLFAGLELNGKGRPRYAVLNWDDPYYSKLAEVTKVPIISYGLGVGALYRARDVEIRIDGITYTVEHRRGSERLNLKLAGKFSVYNSLAAYAVALEEGIEPAIAKAALEEMPGIPGRFQTVNRGQDFAVVVDYAHTPDGLENVLKTARQIATGRVLTVFGCGGDRDRSKRPIMGEKAATLSDFCIVTSDNPRSEEPRSIIADIEAGMGKDDSCYEVIVDREEAIATALNKARTGDIVVIAGKGHENYQIIGEKIIPFDDVAVAEQILTRVR